jgi:HAD superfamily hydrolase (TIGR01509 family)
VIKALIFDFDGTILDTETPDLQAWQAVYAGYGVAFPLERWLTIVGGSPELFDPLAYLEGKLGVNPPAGEIMGKKRRREGELLAGLRPLPGVLDLLSVACDRGLSLAVASSSGRDWVIPHLERLGLLERFACIKCADDVDRVKPAADLYLAVLGELGLQGHQAIAFEDSPNGVTAAKQAGIPCVAIPNAVTARMSLEHASMRLDSLEGLSLEDLLKIDFRAPGEPNGK